jgi:1-pyrroline-5-carboxylate dehydrogenase
MNAKEKWEDLPWEQRAAIFLKAADLIAGPYRAKMNAATMLGQSKNVHQAEIDAACEMIDFLRFNVSFMEQIYKQQPGSGPNPGTVSNNVRSKVLFLPLLLSTLPPLPEILPSSPAIMGNTVVWKPSRTAIYSANVLMEVFQ